MNNIDNKSSIQNNHKNSLFKTCFGIFLIPIIFTLLSYVYIKLLYPTLQFSETSDFFLVALISIFIIFFFYSFVFKNLSHCLLATSPYIISFIIPIIGLINESITFDTWIHIYLLAFILGLILQFGVISCIGFKTLKIHPFKQFILYVFSILIGFIFVYLWFLF